MNVVDEVDLVSVSEDTLGQSAWLNRLSVFEHGCFVALRKFSPPERGRSKIKTCEVIVCGGRIVGGKCC